MQSHLMFVTPRSYIFSGLIPFCLASKLSPAEFSLYIPNKGDFTKHGGFRLDEGRAIGSYRLKNEVGFLFVSTSFICIQSHFPAG